MNVHILNESPATKEAPVPLWKLVVRRLLPKNIRHGIWNLMVVFLKRMRWDINYFYNEDFATGANADKEWTEAFARLVIDMFQPTSIIDFGCGSGDILVPFEKRNIDVLGVDGSKANARHLKIEKDHFLLHDLRKICRIPRKYSLCFCFEVGEHIEEKYGSALVDSIVQASDNIVFTAAPPGQWGIDHCNLKPKEWWIHKYQQRGFDYFDGETRHLMQRMKAIPGIQHYYVENLMVFKKRLSTAQ